MIFKKVPSLPFILDLIVFRVGGLKLASKTQLDSPILEQWPTHPDVKIMFKIAPSLVLSTEREKNPTLQTYHNKGYSSFDGLQFVLDVVEGDEE